MNNLLHRFAAWSALFLMCLVPMSCMVQEEGEVFAIKVPELPATVNDSDYLVIALVVDSGVTDTLYQGPAGPLLGKVFREIAPNYKGGEAVLHIQEYRLVDGGKGDFVQETRIRINYFLGVDTTLGFQELKAAMLRLPVDGFQLLDTHVTLHWVDTAKYLDPQPSYRIFMGTVKDSLSLVATVEAESLTVGPLLRNTLYHWRIETSRGGSLAGGPHMAFFTLPYPPVGLSYPESTFQVGEWVQWLPRYEGGRVSYTVEPPLPAGLELDAMGGTILGTSAVPLDSSRHEVTASNALGEVKATLVLRIAAPPPLEFRIPQGLRKADSMVAVLGDGTFSGTEVLYRGPVPAGEVLQAESKTYSGGETEVELFGFQGGEIRMAFRYRFSQKPALQDSLPPSALPAPKNPVPGDGAVVPGALATLSFAVDPVSLPLVPARVRVYLGTANPPPLFKDSITQASFAPGGLLPDTLYHWRAEIYRLGTVVSGPTWTFRTLPIGPNSFAYPSGKVFRVGTTDTLAPAYGGGPARFRIAPSLPAGLRLDSLTGKISGTPSEAAASAEYTVTASNAAAGLEAKVAFRVDYRLVRIALPEEARESDRAEAWLLSPAGNILDTLWDGPLPDDLQIGKGSAHYDGVRSAAHVVLYQGGLAIREYRYSLTGPAAAASPQALPALAIPSNPNVPDTTAAADTLLKLAWSLAPGLPPAPLFRLYLGHANPPPLYRDSLARDALDSVALLADTPYYWRVEHLRAGRGQMGPLWSFRTRPPKPASVAYADAVLHLDEAASWSASYAGGARVRFKVDPALPEGLALDPLTGRISGTPLAVAAPAAYTVTASNPSGEAEGTLNLEVKPRVLDFLLPDTARQAARIFIELRDSTGALVETVWDAPPPGDLRIRRLAPDYLGGEAALRIQGFKGGILHWESFRRVNRKQGIFDFAELPALPATPKLAPEHNATTADSVVELIWNAAGILAPPAMGAVYLGHANPPPLFKDSVADLFLKPVTLKPDTTYYWTVETVRAGRRTPGSIWTLRTPTTPPSLLSYPAADSVFDRGAAVSLVPAWKSGRGTRFSVSPDLPPGLKLDSLTGTIAGAPASSSARATWVVTARNDAGSLQANVILRVVGGANLVARWSGEEGSGTVLRDTSGNAYHGTLRNMAWVPGVKGKAFSFNGTASGKIDVRDALHLNAFTICLWFKEADQNLPRPLLEYSELAGMLGVHMGTNTTGWGEPNPGDVYTNIRASDANQAQHGDVRERNILWTETGKVVLGQWTHAALTFDPAAWKMRIYINGKQEVEKALQPNFMPLTRGRIHLGFRPADNLETKTEVGFRGQMDEIAIFNGPLDAAEIDALYRAESP